MPGDDLTASPDGRIDAGDGAYLTDARAMCREEQGDQSPCERVVEVVDQPRLRARAQGRPPPSCVGECGGESGGATLQMLRCLLERDLAGGGPDEENWQRASRDRPR